MNTLPLLLGVLCVFALGYRYYSALLAAKVVALDDRRTTPAHALQDGSNYVPTPRWVLFGHHFAAIAGAGPLVGPTLAAQFGFAPGLLWILSGAVLAGAVQDFIMLAASLRHEGRSMPEIARREIGPFAGTVAMIAVLIILIASMAGLGLVVVNALARSPWGVFTIGCTVPIAIGMGFAMFRNGSGQVRVALPSAVGVLLLIAALIGGHALADSSLAPWLSFTPHQITLAMMAYGFIASVLPVWLLLQPRDYLSTYVKLGTVVALVVGVLVAHPDIKFPAFTDYIHGGGPIVRGKLFPFLFVTIACGAISGFHALVSSGTTPKMLDKESDARFIGYGAMLAEGLVGILALIAATSMEPGDYFAINTSPEVFAKLGLHTVNLDAFSREVGEQLAGRTGGAVSLAIGMAQILRGLPLMKSLVGYWYHYAVMFEALFILTTIDAGTRVTRYILQELLGKASPRLARHDSLTGSLLATSLVVSGWGYLIYTGNITTIWPLFGIGNQLLATIALSVATTYLINGGKRWGALATGLPMLLIGVTTLTAGVLSIRDIFWPLARSPATSVQGTLDVVLMSGFLLSAALVLAHAARRCLATLRGAPLPAQAAGPGIKDVPGARCC